MGLSLPWIEFPLSGGVNPFGYNSPTGLSWGLLYLLTAIIAVLGLKKSGWFLIPILVIALAFPLMLYMDYLFFQNVFSENIQQTNISSFANKYLHEPNVTRSTIDASSSELSNIWNAPWKTKVLLTFDSLGLGFWIALVGAGVVSRTLGKREFGSVIVVLLLCSLPGIASDYFLSEGRDDFLKGNYSESVEKYETAAAINASIGNGNLTRTESYNLWVGESLFHTGKEEEPEGYLFLGKNLEGVGSYIKSKELYRRAKSLPPAQKALARVMVKEAVFELQERGSGSSVDRLEAAFKLDPNQLEALFYLTYISFLLKDVEGTLYYAGLLLERCEEGILLSDVYNILGDMYHREEDFSRSRAMYRTSLDVFDRAKKGNYHGWKGIAGW